MSLRILSTGCRSVTAVSCAECVVYIDVGIRSEFLSEVFLTLFHLLLCGIVAGVGFVNPDGLAFLFRIEAEVFEKENLAGLERCGHVGGSHAVGGELNVGTKSLCNGIFNLRERHLGVDLAFGLAHVRHNDERTAVGKHFFQCGEGTTDTGVVGDVAILVEGHIEVYTYDSLLTFEIEIIDSHLMLYVVCILVYQKQRSEAWPASEQGKCRCRQHVFLTELRVSHAEHQDTLYEHKHAPKTARHE